MAIWRVDVRDPAGQGEWELLGQHPTQLEADLQADEYRASHPTGEARVYDEAEGPPSAEPPPDEPEEPPGLLSPVTGLLRRLL